MYLWNNIKPVQNELTSKIQQHSVILEPKFNIYFRNASE
jgi:hypothetical protein